MLAAVSRLKIEVSRRFDHAELFLHNQRMASSFGQLFRITTWGESHGGGVGVVVDGCPPRLKLSEADIQPDLDRRRPGQSKIVTPRKESDTVQILSGTFGGKTLGTPICLWVKNEDARPEAYSEMKDEIPSVARGFHLFRQIRHPRLAGRRTRERARNGRPRRRRRDCEENFARKIRRGNSGLRQASAENFGGNQSRQGEIFRSRIEHRPLPRPNRRRRK